MDEKNDTNEAPTSAGAGGEQADGDAQQQM